MGRLQRRLSLCGSRQKRERRGRGRKAGKKKGKSLTLSPQSPSLLPALPPRDPLRPYPLRHLLRRLPYFPLLACPNSPLASPFTPATQAKCDYPNKPLTLAWPSALSRPGGPTNSLATVVYSAGNRMAAVVFSGKPHVQRPITRKQKNNNNNNKMISAQGNHLLVLKRKSGWSKLTNPGKLNCFFMKAPRALTF